jgi:hypothetical protein
MAAHADGAVAAFTVRFRLALADCGVGWVESITVIATAADPTEVAAGVPVIAPVELLIERPLGRPVALYAYEVMPPDAVIEAL